MPIDFSTIFDIRIPEGEVEEIRHNGKLLWSRLKVAYVSLGDSIAVGHAIDDDWASRYGYQTQYGENGNTQTLIVPGTYTDLIRTDLYNKYGRSSVNVKSFAHSGDTVADLMTKLNQEPVRSALQQANIVTICIGANDVLQPALMNLEKYIDAGDSALQEMSRAIDAKLSVLNTDGAANSLVALFNKLYSINQDATYVFMTIYNPYKYLWLDEGRNGFFKPVLDSIPDMNILGLDVDEIVRSGLLNEAHVRTLYDRVNGLCDWSENFVTRLNTLLKSKIASYSATHPKFLLADAKSLFDGVPDRPVSAPHHYNDLVNVEYTRGYNTMTMDWDSLWQGSPISYWTNLITSHVSTSGVDIGSIALELVNDTVERVIVPDLDPHPESYGHYILKRAFAEVLNWESLARYYIHFNANGGSGTMSSQEVIGTGEMAAYEPIKSVTFGRPAVGYYFTGWNTKPDGTGTAYSNGQLIGLTGDVTLYAQWSDIYTVTFRHSYDAFGFGDGDTGPMECYALWIDGAEQSDLGAFSNGARTYRLKYGTPMGVVVQNKLGSDRCYVTWNGTTVAGKSSDTRYSFNVTSHLDINFEWNFFLDGLSPQSYWNCYISTY